MSAYAPTQMLREVEEMPRAVARLSETEAQAAIKAAAASLWARDLAGLMTVARGSSRHAASYLGYSVQLALGLPVASIGPSLVSIYKKSLRVRGFSTLAISQSGGSEDIIETCRALQDAGANLVSLTNKIDSPLGNLSQTTFDIRAGPEGAVAATKSFMNSVVSGLWLICEVAEDADLREALLALPGAMKDMTEPDWSDKLKETLQSASFVTILSRGPGLGLAQEVALKLIETSGIHATAYSGAEVLHGPSALIGRGHPVILLSDATNGGLDQAADRLSGQGARLITVSARSRSLHPLVDPLLSLQPLYVAIEELARWRGYDPDNPPHLQKETRTL